VISEQWSEIRRQRTDVRKQCLPAEAASAQAGSAKPKSKTYEHITTELKKTYNIIMENMYIISQIKKH
jgi:hypothetical protein